MFLLRLLLLLLLLLVCCLSWQKMAVMMRADPIIDRDDVTKHMTCRPRYWL